MAVLNVLSYPDPRLRKQAEPVTDFDDALRQQVADMFETMYAEEGIGLAATQVDYHRQLIVIDLQREQADDRQVLVNAEILERDGEVVSEEGCLSVPEFRADVKRAERIRLRYQDEHGETVEREADGLLAICIQHEIDHLNGVLFVDHLSRIKRERYRKKLQKLRRQAS